jgi:5-methylcytosine-specific restriction endonuclease McrA
VDDDPVRTLGEVRLTVEELIERDGPECVWCGRELWRRDLTLEHVIPRSRGGHLVAENAVVACRSCNKRRGSKPVDAYVRELLRAGAAVRVDTLDAALGRLAGSGRRAHREPGLRQRRRLASVTAGA